MRSAGQLVGRSVNIQANNRLTGQCNVRVWFHIQNTKCLFTSKPARMVILYLSIGYIKTESTSLFLLCIFILASIDDFYERQEKIQIFAISKQFSGLEYIWLTETRAITQIGHFGCKATCANVAHKHTKGPIKFVACEKTHIHKQKSDSESETSMAKCLPVLFFFLALSFS